MSKRMPVAAALAGGNLTAPVLRVPGHAGGRRSSWQTMTAARAQRGLADLITS